MGSENHFELKFAYPEKLELSDGEMVYDPVIEVGSPVRHVFRLVGKGVDARGLGYSYELNIEKAEFFEIISKLELLKDGETVEIPNVVTLRRDGKTVRGVYLESQKVAGSTQEFSFDYKKSLIFSKNVRIKHSWIRNTFSGKDESSRKDKPKTISLRR